MSTVFSSRVGPWPSTECECHKAVTLLLAQLSRHRGGAVPPPARRWRPCCVLFRVPALFGVFRRDERRSLSCSSPLHLLCCLRAAHALAAARPAPATLGPSSPRRAPRAAPPAAPPAAPRTGPQSARLPLLSTDTEHAGRQTQATDNADTTRQPEPPSPYAYALRSRSHATPATTQYQ